MLNPGRLNLAVSVVVVPGGVPRACSTAVRVNLAIPWHTQRLQNAWGFGDEQGRRRSSE